MAVAFATGASAGEPTQADKVAARALFDEGRNLSAAGKYAEACVKLEESQRLDAGTGTMFNLADCYEHVGKTATAWSLYLEVASRMRSEGKKDREEAARNRARGLEPKLARVVIAVAPEAARVPGLVISRDGARINSAMWGSAIPVDPGRHVVEVSAPGYRKWSTAVESSRDGGTTTVQVPPLVSKDAPVAPVATPPVVSPRPPSSTVVPAPAASIAPAASSAPAGETLDQGVAPVPESSASPAVVRLAPPPNASHTWSLHNRDGSMVCTLPCTRRVRADAGMYVQLDDGSDSETLALTDSLVQPGAAPVDLHVDPGRSGRAAGITLTIFGLIGATMGGIVWGAGASMQPDPKGQGESYDADYKSNKDTADGVERVGMVITLVGAAALLPGIIVWAQAQRPRLTGASSETPHESEPAREVSIGPGFVFGRF